MVNATLATGCHYLGRIPKNVKFEVELVLDDGSYLSWVYPDGKSKKKGGTKIQVRVIEYVIDTDEGQQTYRLITSLRAYCPISGFIASHRIPSTLSKSENTIDELKTHLNGRKTPLRSLKQERSCSRNLWLVGTLCSAVFNVHCRLSLLDCLHYV